MCCNLDVHSFYFSFKAPHHIVVNIGIHRIHRSVTYPLEMWSHRDDDGLNDWCSAPALASVCVRTCQLNNDLNTTLFLTLYSFWLYSCGICTMYVHSISFSPAFQFDVDTSFLLFYSIVGTIKRWRLDKSCQRVWRLCTCAMHTQIIIFMCSNEI